GVRADTVSRWRKALGVGRSNEGSHTLWSANAHEPWAVAARKKAVVRSKSPAALAKLSVAMRGRRLAKHVIEAVRRAHLGTKASDETRRKMSETHLRRGSLPLGVRRWTKGEDALVRWLPASEVALARIAPSPESEHAAG